MDYSRAPEIGKRTRILGGDGTEENAGEIVDERHAEDDGMEFQVKDGEKNLGWHKPASLEVILEEE